MFMEFFDRYKGCICLGNYNNVVPIYIDYEDVVIPSVSGSSIVALAPVK